MVRILGRKEGEFAKKDEVAPTPSPESFAAPGAAAPVVKTLIDVEANLEQMAKSNEEELDWKRSIVDLLKIVGMDSSYGARKELALELGYSKDDIVCKGSAEMNIWLHNEVMRQLAANGGKVPANLVN